MKRLRRALGMLVTALLLAVLGLVALVPALLGGTTLTVKSGSMEPTFSPGDLVVVRTVGEGDLRIGDVITFLPDPDDAATLITHRIVGQRVGPDGASWITRGDANEADDAPVRWEQVRGRYVYSVPWLGWVRQGLQSLGPALYWGIGVLMLVALAWPLLTRGRGPRPPANDGSLCPGPSVPLQDGEASPRPAVDHAPVAAHAAHQLPNQNPRGASS